MFGEKLFRFTASLQTHTKAVAERKAAPIKLTWRAQFAEIDKKNSLEHDLAVYRRAIVTNEHDVEARSLAEDELLAQGRSSERINEAVVRREMAENLQIPPSRQI